jgi:hypothetical protein
MELVNYVNKVGKLINDSTKFKAKLDRTSITNLVLISHLYKLTTFFVSKVEAKEITDEEYITKVGNKLSNYMVCLEKGINFYGESVTTDNCILTEQSEHVTQE